MPERDELDLLVHSALSSYADPDTESGLEERILARIAAEGIPAPRRRWLPWAIALPIAAGLLLLLVFSGSRHTQPLTSRANQAPLLQRSPAVADHPGSTTESPATTAQHAKASLHERHPGREAVIGKAAPLPKLDIFPTPQPLTPEERTFIVFVAQAPETERQSFIEAQKQATAPLSIVAIEIQPLGPPDHGGD